MRLICPECDARYEVDAALIPAQGREVECANCGHRWHQPGEAPAPILLGDPQIAPEVDRPAPVTAPRPSAAALDILREEAARELAQRAAARARVADTGTAAPEHVVGELVEDHEIPQPLPLPDPKALAASLHWTLPEAPAAAPAPPPPPAPTASGYNAGFGLALGLAAALCGAYVAAPHLADAGRFGAALGEYRAEADRARLWLYDRAAPLTDRAIGAVRGLAGQP